MILVSANLRPASLSKLIMYFQFVDLPPAGSTGLQLPDPAGQADAEPLVKSKVGASNVGVAVDEST